MQEASGHRRPPLLSHQGSGWAEQSSSDRGRTARNRGTCSDAQGGDSGSGSGSSSGSGDSDGRALPNAARADRGPGPSRPSLSRAVPPVECPLTARDDTSGDLA